ncbi:MAG: hypothetical protein HOY75_08245 [Streptomyces sp.]|nr:hypothetical protein [Streptomyces sp.]
MTEYEVACLGKTRFPTRATARRRPYQCHFCTLHHLGHRPGHAPYMRGSHHLEDLTQ